jgi:hypothetical protein
MNGQLFSSQPHARAATRLSFLTKPARLLPLRSAVAGPASKTPLGQTCVPCIVPQRYPPTAGLQHSEQPPMRQKGLRCGGRAVVDDGWGAMGRALAVRIGRCRSASRYVSTEIGSDREIPIAVARPVPSPISHRRSFFFRYRPVPCAHMSVPSAISRILYVLRSSKHVGAAA